ncbi:MAG: hypothetical protein U0Z53_09095 [Blastocatellia bacterium]
MNSLSLLRRPGLLIAAASLASLLLVVISIRASRLSGTTAAPPQTTLKVKTPALKLEVASIRKIGRNLEISFRNTDDQGVSAWAVLVEGKSWIQDLIYSGNGMLNPGETKAMQIELASPSSPLPEIRVETVVFDGQKYLGTPYRALEVFYRRAGARRQLASVYPYLARMIAALDGWPDQTYASQHRQLREVMALLSTDKPPDESPSYAVGLQNGRDILERLMAPVPASINGADRAAVKARLSAMQQEYLALMNRLGRGTLSRFVS